ncbi:phenylalanine--tRNA ligase subunit beta [Laspinema olomoucense]|uniref:phenylalanine--tRNA ligase subunit beta n=1 Tax=Laspinema olomoucense TaxID=3231600 RepID=UPI0021BA66C7|nr:phenylalanine--tRNA ligase subunit beta [Laspinema sp. D3d]MCT7971926.1 phenylalanine--tRNA ligase subunit beta [Laspinema sp. D3d]
MRISLNWLRELIDITMSPEELAHTLTMAGFEVEDIEDRRSWANGVVLGKIIEREQHPNADKLSVCKVNIGGESPLNIVCGAPNAKADIYVAVAPIGTYLPKIDLKIKKAKLRGVPSEGMICSLAELGLTKDSEGIHEFDLENPQLGTAVSPLLGLDDVILDLTSTANRADALSMVGVAREVAALTGGALRLPTASGTAITPGGKGLSLKIDESKACPAYIGTEITGVKIAPSPLWLQQRLQAAGVRPINNVVDVTNYILLEWGQPLHAFDRDRLQTLAGGDSLTLGVRFAQSGETFKTLDGQTRTLQAQNLLITANNQPVAIAGVMGGEETEVHDGTENLILEAALFDPPAVRRSSRAVGLRTESSARYERGVNYAGLETACDRAIALFQELAGGTPVHQRLADARPEELRVGGSVQSIELRRDRVNQVLGPIKQGEGTGELQATDIEPILTALGCTLTGITPGQVWSVQVPPYRARDLEREIDLIEEIARLYGYDKFCETLPTQSAAGQLGPEQQARRDLRSAFRSAGLTELMHYSLVKAEQENQIALANPLFVEYSALRTEMLSGAIDAFEYNLAQGNGPLNGFELGRTFWKDGEGLKEQEAIAGILGGDPTLGRWVRSGREQPMSWYEAKGILESVCDRLGLDMTYRPESTAYPTLLHPGRTASLWLQDRAVGVFGQLHPQLRQDRELPNEVYIFQMELQPILDALTQDTFGRKFSAYSSYPSSDRDLAFYAPVDVAVSDLTGVMSQSAGSLLESVQLFDDYRGQNVPEGQRSLAFRLVYRASDRTLTDEEIEPAHQKVRDALVSQFAVSLRS